MQLTIIMPVFNEASSIEKILDKVICVPFPVEVTLQLIVVDDGSTDATLSIVRKYQADHLVYDILVISMEKNKGKGMAIREALKHAEGNYTVIQDGDLEYHPEDLVSMLDTITKEKYDVLYGSRYLGGGNRKKSIYQSYYYGVRFLTFVTNLLYCQKITDEATGYKMFSTDLLRSVPLQCERFEFCPEITAKIAKRGYKIHEIPIHFTPRSKEEGKKIRAIDGIGALWVLLRLRFKESL